MMGRPRKTRLDPEVALDKDGRERVGTLHANLGERRERLRRRLGIEGTPPRPPRPAEAARSVLMMLLT
jgi:hypothetical protein